MGRVVLAVFPHSARPNHVYSRALRHDSFLFGGMGGEMRRRRRKKKCLPACFGCFTDGAVSHAVPE